MAARYESGDRPLGAFVIQRRQDNWSKDRPGVENDVIGISVVTETGSRSLAKEGTLTISRLSRLETPDETRRRPRVKLPGCRAGGRERRTARGRCGKVTSA